MKWGRAGHRQNEDISVQGTGYRALSDSTAPAAESWCSDRLLEMYQSQHLLQVCAGSVGDPRTGPVCQTFRLKACGDRSSCQNWLGCHDASSHIPCLAE
jgi:hypothetical protein